jgi:hypothetical protein
LTGITNRNKGFGKQWVPGSIDMIFNKMDNFFDLPSLSCMKKYLTTSKKDKIKKRLVISEKPYY